VGDIITAAELAQGDVYRPVSLGQVVRCEAFVVREVRRYVGGATYAVVDARNVATGNAASISLREDTLVCRLEEQPRRDVVAYLDLLEEGASVNVVRHDGRFWL